MAKHTRFRITAEQTGSALFLTTHFPCQSPLSAAAEKAAQLHSLLFMLSDYAACSDTFGALNPEFQSDVLSLAAGIAREAQVMSELAAGHRDEAG
ncbi:hypothetical protein [Cupriavidus basilensis]|uniref:hypothetical protein n=1 Tax=Cupriavidus basilensis TaxID=68895 RepID=UPI00284E9D58|nr:hypothetical protein [Cupriavidus basilensis]MDR3380655.1 hypothetical protein [Cupriavidus basilensis]